MLGAGSWQGANWSNVVAQARGAQAERAGGGGWGSHPGAHRYAENYRLITYRARGAQRIAAAPCEHGGTQRHVAAVGERRDNQAPIVALVLVTVSKH